METAKELAEQLQAASRAAVGPLPLDLARAVQKAISRLRASPAPAAGGMTVPDGWQLVPVERSYDMRAHAILAFNSCKGDRDGALQAAWEATLRHSYAPAPSADNALPADSTLATVEGRPVRKGDMLYVDIRGTVAKEWGKPRKVASADTSNGQCLLLIFEDGDYQPADRMVWEPRQCEDGSAHALSAECVAALAAHPPAQADQAPAANERELDLYDEIECDLPYLFGRASLEGHAAGQELAALVRAKMQAARKQMAAQADHSAQAQAECDDCQDTGQVCVGISGQAEDGNAPVFERCPSCGYGDEAQAQADTPEFMCERLRATKLRFCAEAADMIEKLAAQAQAGEVALPERVKELIETHGSLRSAARALEIDAGYLHRLGSGEKQNPDDGLLEKMGLRRVIYFERAVRALAAGAGMQGQDAKDAARYRWLRDCVIPDEAQEWICAGKFDDFGVDGLKGQELDAAIDKAVYATREAGK
jgi:hypothetical protein